MGLAQATTADISLGYDALRSTSALDSFDLPTFWDAVTASSDPGFRTIESGSTSPCFASPSTADRLPLFFGIDCWNPSSGLGAWPNTSVPQGSVNYHFQTPSDLIGSQSLEGPSIHPQSYGRYCQPVCVIPPPERYACEWPRCSKAGNLTFNNVEEWKSHLKDHAQSVRNCWRPLEACGWYGCLSKARHKTAKLFEDHLNNIHINPLVCTVAACKHRTPFRGKADLQRHINSVHSEGIKAKCPFARCTSEGREFSRKDKLIIHLRDSHDTEPCPFAHCTIRLDPRIDSTAKHIGKIHGEFECGLGSCKACVSQFSESGFLEHLQVAHKMGWEAVLDARDMAKNIGNKTLNNEHVRCSEAYDCSACCAFK